MKHLTDKMKDLHHQQKGNTDKFTLWAAHVNGGTSNHVKHKRTPIDVSKNVKTQWSFYLSVFARNR